jgi:hypothetical protein
MNNKVTLFQGERSTYAEFKMELVNSLMEKSVYRIATNSQPRPLDLPHAPWHDLPENEYRLYQARTFTSNDQLKWDNGNEKAWSIIMNSLHMSLRLRFQSIEPMRANYLIVQLENRYGGIYDVDQIASFKMETTIACHPTERLEVFTDRLENNWRKIGKDTIENGIELLAEYRLLLAQSGNRFDADLTWCRNQSFTYAQTKELCIRNDLVQSSGVQNLSTVTFTTPIRRVEQDYFQGRSQTPVQNQHQDRYDGRSHTPDKRGRSPSPYPVSRGRSPSYEKNGSCYGGASVHYGRCSTLGTKETYYFLHCSMDLVMESGGRNNARYFKV